MKGAHPLARHGEGRVEPLLESAAALEDGGQQEVKQRPQLGQLVLQRRAGEQQAAWRHVVRVQHLRQLAVVVLHAVAFVHDHVLPTDLERRLRSVARKRTENIWLLLLHVDESNGEKPTKKAFAQFHRNKSMAF